MRAEDHVARLSAFYHPVTPAQVVRQLTSANDVTSAHNAVCSMSILSCDPGELNIRPRVIFWNMCDLGPHRRLLHV